MSKKRLRADALLVQRGLFDSRSRAQAAIRAGLVEADGGRVAKPGQLVAVDAELSAAEAHPYVSRAALKLAHGLDAFGIDPAGLLCLDIGASTGGFTQVLLERGARRVVAVDVGTGQLHASLRDDPRVLSLEQQDARKLTAGMLGGAPALLVCDASFISLAKLLDAPLSLAAPGAVLLALFKPQFEVGRDHLGKGGLVRPDAPVGEARDRFAAWLEEIRGWAVRGWAPSPIPGGSGNSEWLVCANGPGASDAQSAGMMR